MEATLPPLCPQCQEPLAAPPIPIQVEDDLRYCPRCQLPLVVVAGKYLLEKKIAEGGGGIVFLARHLQLQTEPIRAIKFLKPEFLGQATSIQRFLRELQITAVISKKNDHVVRVYDDFGKAPKLGYYYVMEYLEGRRLDQLLRCSETLPSIDTVFRIFQQICLAIHEAHQAKVIHRDIKAENIFLTRRGNDPYFVKVLDFGIAKSLDGVRLTHAEQQAFGTPLYMAPEQWMGKGVDVRSDVYSLGILLFEMLVGHTPFHKRDVEESVRLLQIAKAHVSQAPPAPCEVLPERYIPPALNDVVLKAIAKHPNERFQSVQELLQALLDIEVNVLLEGAETDSMAFVPSVSSQPHLIGKPQPLKEEKLPSGVLLHSQQPVASANPAPSRLNIGHSSRPFVAELTLPQDPTPDEPFDAVSIGVLPPTSLSLELDVISGFSVTAERSSAPHTSAWAIEELLPPISLIPPKRLESVSLLPLIEAEVGALRQQKEESSSPSEEFLAKSKGLVVFENTEHTQHLIQPRPFTSKRRLWPLSLGLVVLAVLGTGALFGVSMRWSHHIPKSALSGVANPTFPVSSIPSSPRIGIIPKTAKRTSLTKSVGASLQTAGLHAQKVPKRRLSRVHHSTRVPALNRKRVAIRRTPRPLHRIHALVKKPTKRVQATGCPPDSALLKWIRVEIQPGSAKIRTNAKLIRFSDWICLRQTRGVATEFRATAPHFQPCSFRTSFSRRKVRLRLLPDSSDNSFDSPLDYCLQ